MVVTGLLERWYIEDVGGGYAKLHGNVFGDSKSRFVDGESIYTSKFKLDRKPSAYKAGDVVETTFSIYQLGQPRSNPTAVFVE